MQYSPHNPKKYDNIIGETENRLFEEWVVYHV